MSEHKCPHCGASLPQVRDAFCATCREPLDEPAEAFHAPVKQDSVQPQVETPHDDKIGMNAEQKAGRATLLWLFTLLFVLLLLAAMDVYMTNPGRLNVRAQVVQLVLTIALCCWLYLGSVVAKWITIILLATGALIGVLGLEGGGDPMGRVLVLAMVVSYVSFMVVLIVSPRLNAFLAYQRGEQEPVKPTLHQ